MPLQDYLGPGETIKYQAPFKVKMLQEIYDLYLTDRRLILYNRKGRMFKRDNFLGERLGEIRSIGYDEVGRSGIIQVVTGTKVLCLVGKARDMTVLYRQLPGLTSNPPPSGEASSPGPGDI